MATISLARTADEEERLIQALRELFKTGHPVVVSDGGSGEQFLNRLGSEAGVTGTIVTTSRPLGLISQVQAALRLAKRSNPEAILYTEPDKLEFFQRPLRRFLDRLPALGDLLLFARNRASFETFPEGQRLTESLMNTLCGEQFGVQGDFCYGPMIIDPALVSPIERIDDPEIGWGWRPFAMAVAYRLGQKVRLVEGNYPCPPDQRDENDDRSRIYRMTQLAQNVRGLVRGLTCTLE